MTFYYANLGRVGHTGFYIETDKDGYFITIEGIDGNVIDQIDDAIIYGYTRFEMGYASAIAVVLFLTMIICNKFIQSLLNRVGH